MYAWAANWSGGLLYFSWYALTNAWLPGVSAPMNQAAPEIAPSAAWPASFASCAEFRPFPPMKRTEAGMPSWRPWTMMPAASSASAERMIACGFSVLIFVSCAEKSVSPFLNVSVVTVSIFRSVSACLKTS